MVSEPGRSCTTITAAKEEFAELKKRPAGTSPTALAATMC
jgi:hypothetical protein